MHQTVNHIYFYFNPQESVIISLEYEMFPEWYYSLKGNYSLFVKRKMSTTRSEDNMFPLKLKREQFPICLS